MSAILLTLFCLGSNKILSEWLTTADQLTVPALVIDLMRDISNWGGWQLSRASFLFPDALTYAILYFFSGDRFLSLVWAQAPMLLIWLYVLYYAVGGGAWTRLERCLWAVTIGLFLPVLLLNFFPELNSYFLKFQFTFASHFSCYVLSMLALILTANSLEKRKSYFFVLLLLVLIAMSNRLVWVFYFIPVIVTSFIFLRKKIWTWFRFALSTSVAIYIGLRIETSLERTSSMPYQISVDALWNRFFLFVNDFFKLSHSIPFLVYFLFCIFVSILGLFYSFKWAKENLSKQQLNARVLVFISASLAICINVGVGFLAWESSGSLRYLDAFLWSPLFLLGFILASRGRVVSSRRVLIGGSCVIIFSTLFVLLSQFKKSIFYSERKNAEELAECVHKQGHFRGLANYWYAKNLQFLSQEKLSLSQISSDSGKDHLLFYWANNLFSYRMKDKSNQGFDFVFVQSLDPQTLKDSFGAPQKEFYCDGQLIWGYNNSESIFAGLIKNGSQLFEKEIKAFNQTEVPVCAFSSFNNSRNCTWTGQKLSLSGLRLSLPSGRYKLSLLGDFESLDKSGDDIFKIYIEDQKEELLSNLVNNNIQFTLQNSATIIPQIEINRSKVTLRALKVERWIQ